MRKRVPLMAEHAVGTFAVMLIWLIARLVTPADAVQRTHLGQMRGFLARRALDAIAVVGWTVDRVSGASPARVRDRQLREIGAA